jgi:DNA repair protein RadD
LKLQLRDYQQAAIDGLYDYWAAKRGDNPLIVAPTGAGKSLIIAKLIEDAMSFAGTRVMVLTHVKELLEQNARELLENYPQAEFAFYSASIGQKRLDQPITFAGIQSVWEKAFDMIPPPDLVLIDEAHMLPKKTTTRYGKFIADLRTCNPSVKIVGLTATPYRLDSGYLHKGEGAIFDGICYDIPVAMLMERGYLSPVVSRGSAHKIDLSNVHMRGGEFIESELATAASDPALVRATVAEIVELGTTQNRKAWLIFASGVKHAEMLQAEFAAHGVASEVVTGADSNRDRSDKIEAFKAGRLRCLINVNVLTTGFNVPAVDLVALVRATASTGLYVQMVGRGTRLASGKENCLILDYGQNVERHGFIDAVKPKDKASSGEGSAPVKECPQCQTLSHTAVRICAGCGYEFPAPQLNHAPKSYGGAILSSQVPAEWVDVDDVAYAKWSKEGKPDSIRVTYICGLQRISEWFCPDHGGYAASRYHARMAALTSSSMNTKDALLECEAWVKPSRIKIKPNGKFFDIVQLDYSPKKVDHAKLEEEHRIRELAAAMFGDDDSIAF